MASSEDFEQRPEDLDELEDSDVWEEEVSQDVPLPASMVSLTDSARLPEGLMENLNPLERVLKDKTDLYASKIVQLVMEYKIQPNDPIFVILVAMQELELMMVDVPLQIEQVCTEYESRMNQMLHKYFGATESEAKERYQSALAGIKQDIAAAAKELIIETRDEQFTGNLLTLGKMAAPALAMLLGAIGLGVLGTLQYHQLKTQTLLGTGKLTPEQYDAMEWGMSREGKQAQEIMKYNAGYVGETCQQDAEAMNLRLQFGERTVTSGFCLLFVEPPNKRRYE